MGSLHYPNRSHHFRHLVRGHAPMESHRSPNHRLQENYCRLSLLWKNRYQQMIHQNLHHLHMPMSPHRNLTGHLDRHCFHRRHRHFYNRKLLQTRMLHRMSMDRRQMAASQEGSVPQLTPRLED